LRRNLLASGEFSGRSHDPPGGHQLPALNVMAANDHVVPPTSKCWATSSGDDVTSVQIPAGHRFVAGRDAARITLERIMEWLNQRS
jgi:hypothetical protein